MKQNLCVVINLKRDKNIACRQVHRLTDWLPGGSFDQSCIDIFRWMIATIETRIARNSSVVIHPLSVYRGGIRQASQLHIKRLNTLFTNIGQYNLLFIVSAIHQHYPIRGTAFAETLYRRKASSASQDQTKSEQLSRLLAIQPSLLNTKKQPLTP